MTEYAYPTHTTEELLWLRTQAERSRDFREARRLTEVLARRDRGPAPQGKLAEPFDPFVERRSPNARLSEDDVRAMRRAYWTEYVSMAELGRRFGVSASNVQHIMHGRIWKDIA